MLHPYTAVLGLSCASHVSTDHVSAEAQYFCSYGISNRLEPGQL